MSNFNIQIVGNANLKQMTSEFALLERRVEALNNELRETVVTSHKVNPAGYRKFTKAVAMGSQVYRDAAASTGLLEASQLRLNSATDEYTKSLMKQKISFNQWRKQAKVAKAAYKEQLALQQMVVSRLPGTKGNKYVFDVVTPNTVSKELDTLSNKFGFLREQIRSATTQMVNWGKNTQWAGRQLMVGFTVPIAAFGAATGKLAYDIDKQMTRVQKVYDTVATDVAGKEAELSKLRADSMAMASTAARRYGSSVADTLEVEADLAAVGLQGQKLLESTTQVVRSATLGEIDYQTALKAHISLQSILNQTTQETNESWDYMNAIENATSLATEDFAKAIPIALGPMKEMGAGLQDLALLMVAMKERGIAAGEGANAIKSMMQRLYRPSKQIRQEWQELANINLTEMVRDAGGDIMKILPQIASAVEDLERPQRVQLLGGLFGTYQVARQNAVLNGLRDIGKETAQTTRVMEINNQAASEWAETRERELQAQAESMSGRFKRAVETLKAELADMGEPFLEVGSQVVSVIAKIVQKFNDLPDGAKKMLAIVTIAAAVIGPIVMLTGLFANMVGTVTRLGINIVGLGVRYELLDKQSMAARLAAEMTSAGFDKQALAAQHASQMVDMLNAAMVENSIVSRQAMGSSVGKRSSGNWDGPSGAPGVQGGKHYAVPFIAPGEHNPDGDDVKGMSKGMKVAATSSVIMAGALATSAISQNEMVDSAANWALITAGIAPLLVGIPWKSMGGGIANASKNLKDGFIPAITNAKGGILSAVTTFARFVGPTGLIVGAITAMGILYTKIDDNAEALERMASTGDKWAEIFNYERREAGTFIDPKTGEVVDTLTKRVQDLNKAAPEVGESIRGAMDLAGEGMNNAKREAIAMNIAIRQGLIVRREGGTAEDARNAVETSLMAGLNDINKVKDIMTTVDLQVDFNVDKSVMNENLRQTINQIRTSVKDEVAKTKAEAFFDFFGGGGGMFSSDISEGSRQAGRNAANAFASEFANATREQQIAMGRRMQKEFDSMGKAAIAPLLKNKGLAKLLGISDSSTSSDVAVRLMAPGAKEDVEAVGLNYEQIVQNLDNINHGNKNFVRDMAEAFGWSEQTASQLMNIEDLLKLQVEDYMNIGDAQYAYNRQIQMSGMAGKYLSDQTKLQILNMYRVRAGLKETTNLEDGFGKATKDAADGIKDQGDEQGRTNSKIREALSLTQMLAGAAKEVDLGSMMRDTMSGIQQEISDNTMSAFDSRMEASIEATQEAGERAMDALQNRQERAQKALENMQERRRAGIEKSYDARIKAVNNQIEAEQKADDIRQKLFEAEMERLDRLAEAANRSIDFNAALSSGDFDEAARIRNDAQAEAETSGFQDAVDRASERSQKKQDALGGRVDSIEEAKKKRLDALSDVEEREKEALQRSQERRREALQDEVDANNEAQRKIWEDRKEYLTKALEDFTGYTAMSSKDLKAHIENWKNEYKGLNLSTEDMFALTVDNINAYVKKSVEKQRAELVNEAAWEKFGGQIATSMIKGAFGMTKNQFFAWLAGGEPPTGEDRTAGKRAGSPGGFRPGAQDTVIHTGGLAGKIQSMSKGRVGFARNAPQSRNEVRALLKMGEYVVNDGSVSKYGIDKMDAINSGTAHVITASDLARAGRAHNEKRNTGGLGVSGLAGAAQAGVVSMAIARAIQSAQAPVATSGKSSGAMMIGKPSTSTSGSVIQGPGGTFRPVSGGSISQYLHDSNTAYPAYDISIPNGTPVRAVASGRIIASYDIPGYESRAPHGGLGYRSYGRVITQAVPGGSVLYGHLSERYAKPGQMVSGGSVIGKSGNTGYSFGPHLHFGASGMSPAVWLEKGAENIRWDNTLANLHHGEAVLTKDISAKFRQGVDNFANGGNNTYNLNMTFTGDGNSKEEIARYVIGAIKKAESRKPRSRTN